jgi:hypothetical protein
LPSNLLNQGGFAHLPRPGQYLNELGTLFEAAEQERCLWPLEGLAGATARSAWAGGLASTRHCTILLNTLSKITQYIE